MKKVGEVLESEKQIIYDLYEKRNALVNLLKILDDTDKMWNDAVNILEFTRNKEKEWWKEKEQKYKWYGETDKSWVINFRTNEIFLIKR